jgi:hypothetical protein
MPATMKVSSLKTREIEDSIYVKTQALREWHRMPCLYIYLTENKTLRSNTSAVSLDWSVSALSSPLLHTKTTHCFNANTKLFCTSKRPTMLVGKGSTRFAEVLFLESYKTFSGFK